MSKKQLLLLLVGGGLVIALLHSSRGPADPLPYRFEQKIQLLTPEERAMAQETTLLILGDRHGTHFTQYLHLLRKKIAPLFRDMKILNLSAQGHGIHRSLRKLQELPHIPTLVLFLGGYDEFVEDKFAPSQYRAIKKNFAAFADNRKLSLMALVPPLAPWLVPSFNRHRYNDKIVPSVRAQDPTSQQQNLELRFKTYEFEVEQLIEWSLRRGSVPILVTAPLALKAPPHQVCVNSSTPALEKKLVELQKLLEGNDIKTAIKELSQLERVAIAHAGLFHLKGWAHYRQGEFKRARQYFAKANSFDCLPKGSSHVLNNILRSKAKDNATPLLDFDTRVAAHLGKGPVFEGDSIYPLDKHYHYFLQSLADAINQQLERLSKQTID